MVGCLSHRCQVRAWSTCALLTLLISGACSAPTPPTTPAPLPMTRFRADPVAYMWNSGFDQPATFIVRDRTTWESIWNQLHSRHTPVPPLPAVDFSSEMVAVAALGAQSTAGYDLVLTNASESEGTVTVEATTRTPAPQCAILPVVTSPVDLARLP